MTDIEKLIKEFYKMCDKEEKRLQRKKSKEVKR